MAIQEISQNQLFDQSTINNIVKEVNALSDKVTRASSKIYNTNDSTVVEAYIGSFSIATYQTGITLEPGKNSVSPTIAFNNNFAGAPLVFAQVSSENAQGSFRKAPISVVTSNITASGCTINVTVSAAPTTVQNAVLSVMAIGLTLL